jgi:hypothetical protein
VLCYVESLWSWLLSVWFEILRDFVDYRSYMGSSLRIWSFQRLFLNLCSYNLDGSVTLPTRLLPGDAASDFAPTIWGMNGGPVQARWCYTIERCLKILWKKCRNKAKIEASVAEAFILEVSNFTMANCKDGLPSMHNRPTDYNTDESSSNLSLFKGLLGKASTPGTKTLGHDEWHTIMLYVLLNLDKVKPYVQ